VQLSELGGARGDGARQKTCLLMASAISLQLARDCKDETEQVNQCNSTVKPVAQFPDLIKQVDALDKCLCAQIIHVGIVIMASLDC